MKEKTSENWEAFGLMVLARAKSTMLYYRGGQHVNGMSHSMSRQTAEWILEQAGILRLIDVEEEEMKKFLGGHR